MKKLTLLMTGLLFVLLLAACGSNSDTASGADEKEEKLTIEHELGTTEVAKNPEKIVTFDMGALDTLDKLGVDVTGVPQQTLPDYLSKYSGSDYENIGGLKEPDLEKIAEINPDVIFISGRQSDYYEQLSELAPTIFIGIDTTDYMNSFKKNTETIAQIVGKEEEAKTALTEVDDAIADLKAKAESMDGKALITLVNDGSVSAYGKASRFGVIHDVYGVPTVDETIESSTHGQSVGFEYISEKNPDYLFVVDRGAVVGKGASSAEKVLDNELVNSTTAAKENQITYLDPGYWYLSGGGLESEMEKVKEISDALK
ncbi:iron complex transport system substrate-binding protein [Terribacillus aidingensis]|uniref:Iron complex transport system substrate-binding protein n=1 Tax=Terribacillus aidingensis TaxID=586416 RepID=A0A285N9P4_9BACI|nr:siderophore ABC transporter substrate-binding protein [Terribacillus aidingensis]SNZ05637.1 iron complex transport system substrate-binding protein [Terribacillus aidingensis]